MLPDAATKYPGKGRRHRIRNLQPDIVTAKLIFEREALECGQLSVTQPLFPAGMVAERPLYDGTTTFQVVPGLSDPGLRSGGEYLKLIVRCPEWNVSQLLSRSCEWFEISPPSF